MASPRSKSTTRFYASAMPSGVDEKDWVKQELQRLADAVFAQMDKDKKELQSAVDTLTERLTSLEIAQAGNAIALVQQLRVDVDNLTGSVQTNSTNILSLAGQITTTNLNLATTNANLATTNSTLAGTNLALTDLTARFNILTDQP